MRAVATWCVRHRLLVVAGWLLILVLCTAAARAAGSDYSSSLNLPNTDSSRATELLETATTHASGASEQVVVESRSAGRLTEPAAKARVEAILARIAELPHVTRVVSPYTPEGAAQISGDQRVAFAAVTFDGTAEEIPVAVAERFVETVASGDGPELRAAVTGQVAEAAGRPAPVGAAFGILAAAVVLLLVFGSVTAMLLPVISAIVSIGTAMALVELLTHVMGIADNSAELILLVGLGVGIDYALFIVTRHRQYLVAGRDVDSSIVDAVQRSGRAVLFAGCIVCLSILGMFALGVNFFYGMAVATSIGVALTMAASLTLLPAMLGLLGHRVLSRRQRARMAASPGAADTGSGFWERWSESIARRPVLPAVAAFGMIVVISLPLLSLRLGASDQGNHPPHATTRQAYDMLSRGFGPGFNGPLILTAKVHDADQRAALDRVASAVARRPGVAKVATPQLLPASGGEIALVTVYPATAPQDAATTTLLEHLRGSVIPAAQGGSDLRVHVGGTTAVFADFADVLSSRLPLFLGAIVGLSFLLLLVIFRSLLVPLTAALTNLLSIGAAFGVLVAVFQWGWLGEIFGVTRPGPIESYMPAMMFAIVFGLSMDYQVFLLTRVQEEWERSGDNEIAVRRGTAATGRTITAAALIMILVFAAFMLGDDRFIKEFGLGLAVAVFIDAVVIRSALVPAVMQLLGRSNWWLPGWMSRLLPRITLEQDDDDHPAPPRSREMTASEIR
ncbi:MMPL family transporter [Actinomadura sp. HBU206391]|uniref:MMPL family transporter n=1 Tax=Actinomadura sp. HBU206391 TaxID=2731692 RepID=UPI001650154D|nr:MMPL family transporter [Actinomadura sp. HBU206391]MBC6459680.1 MMPL family transporter [Actinomadura sp. HBU206391]